MHDFPYYRALICVAAIALSLLVDVLGIVVIVTITRVRIFVLFAAEVAGLFKVVEACCWCCQGCSCYPYHLL